MLVGTILSVYLDNVMVFAHFGGVDLQKYQEADLTLNSRNHTFVQASIPFLGHIVFATGLATNSKIVRAREQ